MEVRRVGLEMAHILRTGPMSVFPQMICASYSYDRELEVAVSHLGLSSSKRHPAQPCGEFANMKNSWKINMGPLATRLQPPGGIPPNPQSDGLGYNPRCPSRDFSLQAANETRDDQVAALIRDHDSIGPFQTVFGGEFAKGLMGAHTGGHTTTGGDAGSDFMNAPVDPVFWPQHAMVDRVYWTWQNSDIKKREMAFTGGTSGIGDGGLPASIDDILTLGDYVVQPNITIRSAMSTLGGPFCYVYA